MFSQAQNFQGKVIDKMTRLPIPFANIVWITHQVGTVANINGHFEIIKFADDTLSFSAIGYRELKLLSTDFPVNGQIELINKSEVLGDVQIKVRKKRRKRKQDKSYLLHQSIAKNRSKNNLKKKSYYDCEVYNKIEVDLNNVDSTTKNSLLFKPIGFVFDHPDTVSLKKPFSPIFFSEGFSNYYFKKGSGEKEVVLASKNAGIKIPSVAKYTGNVYTDFNIYNNYLRIFQKQFVSPLAQGSWLSYKYFITDSLKSGDTTFYRLDFKPRREEDLAFDGYLITDDKSHGLNEIKLSIPKRCNINFIEEFEIKQKYTLMDSVWVLEYESILIDVNPLQKSYGFYIQKNTHWMNYSFDENQNDIFFTAAEKTEVRDSAYEYGDVLLEKYRPEKLDTTEKSIYSDIDSAMNTMYLKVIQNLSLMAYTGYYPFKYWEYGPYYTTYSFNNIEGQRLRAGFQTTQNLLKYWRINGHVAHGVGDKITKYKGLVTKYYGFDKWRFIEFEHLNDFKILSASDNAFQEDNILASLTRRVDPRYTHTIRSRFTWSHEWFNGINNSLELKTEKLIPLGSLIYRTSNDQFVDDLRTYTVKFGGRLAVDEKFVRYGFRRLSLSTRNPRLDYSYTYGMKFKGLGYEFHKLEFDIADRYFFGFFGFLDVKFLGGKIWGSVPYPLLLNHQGNDSYYFDNQSFNLMNPFEFASDQYVSLMFKYNFNGLISNRLPLFKRLKIRSFIFANAIYGTLNSNHEDIILLPNGLSSLDEPYLETGFGFDNIFKVIRLDFIWRLTNKTSPQIQTFGITFDIVPSF